MQEFNRHKRYSKNSTKWYAHIHTYIPMFTHIRLEIGQWSEPKISLYTYWSID